MSPGANQATCHAGSAAVRRPWRRPVRPPYGGHTANSPLATSTTHAVWQRAARSIGLDATPHDLRHYFASIQIRSGQSIKVLQALVGSSEV